jgi:hypothetical protein
LPYYPTRTGHPTHPSTRHASHAPLTTTIGKRHVQTIRRPTHRRMPGGGCPQRVDDHLGGGLFGAIGVGVRGALHCLADSATSSSRPGGVRHTSAGSPTPYCRASTAASFWSAEGAVCSPWPKTTPCPSADQIATLDASKTCTLGPAGSRTCRPRSSGSLDKHVAVVTSDAGTCPGGQTRVKRSRKLDDQPRCTPRPATTGGAEGI